MSQLRPDGRLILAIGVSRSGKSVFVKRAIESDKRVLAFDPKGEYAHQMGYDYAESPKELIKLLASSKGDARISFVKSDKKSFDLFCDAAFNWNRQTRITAVCEELANVTNVGRASGHWGRFVSQGLAFGPKIIGTVQRGQEVDKSIMNNASFIHVARHNTLSDREYIAQKLGCPVDCIPSEPLKFIQWTSDRGIVVKGEISFQKNKNKNWVRGIPRFKKSGSSGRVLTFDGNAEFKQVNYR